MEIRLAKLGKIDVSLESQQKSVPSFSIFLPHFKNIDVRLIECSKLTRGINENG